MLRWPFLKVHRSALKLLAPRKVRVPRHVPQVRLRAAAPPVRAPLLQRPRPRRPVHPSLCKPAAQACPPSSYWLCRKATGRRRPNFQGIMLLRQC